jgi:hypothetical protein
VIVMLYAGFHSFPRALLGGDVPAAPIRRTWWRTSGPGGRATSGPPRCGSRWGNSVDLRACAADARQHRPVVPAGDSKAEFALLREARLAVFPSDWGHYADGGHDRSSAQCSGRRSRCRTGAVGGNGRLPTT